jgi:hypothetical protein
VIGSPIDMHAQRNRRLKGTFAECSSGGGASASGCQRHAAASIDDHLREAPVADGVVGMQR